MSNLTSICFRWVETTNQLVGGDVSNTLGEFPPQKLDEYFSTGWNHHLDVRPRYEPEGGGKGYVVGPGMQLL